MVPLLVLIVVGKTPWCEVKHVTIGCVCVHTQKPTVLDSKELMRIKFPSRRPTVAPKKKNTFLSFVGSFTLTCHSVTGITRLRPVAVADLITHAGSVTTCSAPLPQGTVELSQACPTGHRTVVSHHYTITHSFFFFFWNRLNPLTGMPRIPSF